MAHRFLLETMWTLEDVVVADAWHAETDERVVELEFDGVVVSQEGDGREGGGRGQYLCSNVIPAPCQRRWRAPCAVVCAAALLRAASVATWRSACDG